MNGRPHRLLVLATGAIAVVGAALSWSSVFPLGAVLRTTAVAVAVPTALVIAAVSTSSAHRRPPAWLLMLTSAAAWILLIPLALPQTPGAAGPSISPLWILTSLRGCWSGLLTTAPPIPPDPSLLIGLYTLVWFASVATCEVLARTGRVMSALPFGFAVLALGILLGTGDRSMTVVAAGIFVFCALALMTIDRGGPSSWRFLTIALTWTAAVTISAVSLAPAAVGARSRQPFDPRRLVHPQVTPNDLPDPLNQVSAWLAQAKRPLFTVTASAPQNWRLAVLDRFDGQTWTTGASFLPAGAQSSGGETPETAGAIAPTRSIQQSVTIGTLSGRWLPAAPGPTKVAGPSRPDILADPATGVLLSRSPLAPGRRYEVTSQIRDYTADELSAAVPDPAGQQYAELPDGLPDTLHKTADQATAGAASPFQQAARLERYLQANERNDAAAPPGHTYGHLAYFLGTSHQGTSEQFATAFAVMARSLGLPTRIAVGFLPGTQTAPGTWQITGADALVWPEVDFAGLGWVAFFPTPTASTDAAAAVPAIGQSAEREAVEHALDQPAAPKAAAPAPAPAPPSQQSAARADHRSTWPIWLIPAAAAPLGYVALVLAWPSLRRRRRRRLACPEQSVQAAWADVLGRLRWIGIVDIAASTNHEVAEAAARRLGSHENDGLAPLTELVGLAAMADAAAYGGPASCADLRDIAWEYRDRLAVSVRRTVGPWAALGRRVHPTELRR